MILIPLLALGQAASKPVKVDLLAQPKIEARRSCKYIFAVFTATWCRPCSDLKALLAKPSFAGLFNQKFMTIYFDVSDSSKTMNLLLRTQYCSDKAPMPAYAVIDSTGKLVSNGFGNSVDKKHQRVLSYPLTKQNVGEFLRMLNKVPKGLDTNYLWKLRSELEKEVR